MTTTDTAHREAAIVREIEHEANTALAAVPEHLRSKQHPVPTGSTRLVFSHRPTTPDTRKA